MNPNVGPLDATIRWTAAVVSSALAVAFNEFPVIALTAALLALVMAGTALTRVCPLYRFFGVTTCTRKTAPKGAQALILLLALPLAQPAAAQSDPGHKLVLRPESRLWLEGSSNLHDWSCDATEVIAEIRVRSRRDSVTGTDAPSAVERVTVSVPVQRIECANRQMDGNLRKTLNAKDYPTIQFAMTGGELVAPPEKGRLTVLARGELTVAGTTRAIEFRAEGADTGDRALRITGTQEILMTDYGIRPPTALMGLLKTANQVLVRFDLVADYVELEAHLSAAAGTGRP